MQFLPKAYPTDDLNTFMAAYAWDGKIEVRFMPVEFAQAIIKMCFSYAIAGLGFGSFRPLCLPQILSQDKNISYIFGQNRTNEPIKGVTKVWTIELSYRLFQERLLLTAKCSIIPGMGTPIYEVVIGDLHDREQIALFRHKLINNSFKIEVLGVL